MTNAQTLQTIFELVLILLILLGIKYEPVLSEWEEKTFYKILDRFKRSK